MSGAIFYMQGMNGADFPASYNPYRKGTRPFNQWLRGWRAARYDRYKRRLARRSRNRR